MTQFQPMQLVAATKTCVGAVNLRVSLWMKSLSVTIEKKTTKHYFPMVPFNVLCKVVLTFEFVGEFPKCDHSLRNYCAVLFWESSVLLLLVSLCCFC